MSEIPYTPLTGKIQEYFKKFQEAGVPDKVDRAWLKLLGFKGGNDYYIIKVLSFIGFIDSSNVPTAHWKMYKDPTRSGAVMAKAIREGYKDLFATYKDAHRKDHEALYAFFSSKTGKARRTVEAMVTTFVNLCKLADFEEEPPAALREPKIEVQEEVKGKLKPAKGVVSEMHINIQLHLPATDDSKVYDRLFKSLRKHLLSDEEE